MSKEKKKLNDNTREIRVNTQPEPKRKPWYLITGVVLGLILGLVYAWLVDPAVYEGSSPNALGEQDKDHYRSTIAQVYAATDNFQRAALRLALLEDSNLVHTLGAQAQRALATGSEKEARALALLASAVQGSTSSKEIPENPSPTEVNILPGIPTHTLPVPTVTP